MSTPFLGEVKLVSFNFAPKGWALCNGQLLPINQNQALFSLLGTTYGGNGQTTFALPDLRGRSPIHMSSTFNLGQAGGQEAHTITMSEMPAHSHFIGGTSTVGTLNTPTGNIFGASNVAWYHTAANSTLVPSEVSNVGGSQAHANRQPFLVVNFVIALTGIFPSRN